MFRIDVSATRRTLTRLNLSFNNLQFLDGKTLQNFEKLVHIDLSNNQLIEIHAHAFKNCPQLTYITLKNNNLRRIWPRSFAHQVKSVFLKEVTMVNRLEINYQLRL